jgi:hypothetical protein
MKMTIKHLFGMLYVCLLLSIVADFVVHLYLHPEGHFSWGRLPVYSAVYGFIGCIVIILVSRAIGHLWLLRDEDYYEKREKLFGEDIDD